MRVRFDKSRTWTDQPTIVENYLVSFNGRVGKDTVEIRQASHEVFYVTVGNLFGSETLRCHSASAMLAVLSGIASGKKALDIPPGAELVA